MYKLFKMWSDKPEAGIYVSAKDLDEAIGIARMLDASICSGQVVDSPELKDGDFLTAREWLDSNNWNNCYRCTYGEDQPGGFGRKGWDSYGGTPEQFYVMGVIWHHYIGGLCPELIVTIKLYVDEGITA